jgi:MerR family transcriptional regulator, light-induced transcriptional regulator
MSKSETEPNQLHPIGVVAERTGLTPEVLRVWERRYGAVVPVRAAGGVRLYSDEDVVRLKLLRAATRAGRQIGQVALLPFEDLKRLVQEDQAEHAGRAVGQRDGGEEAVVAEALQLARALDGSGLESLLKRRAAIAGTQNFLHSVVGPFLRSIGDEWHSGRLSVGQEHLATRVVQRVVMTSLESLRPPPGAPVFIAAALSGDRHEMGVLLAAVTAASEGWDVVLLGADLPVLEIVAAARARDAAAVGISVVFVEAPDRAQLELATLRAELPASTALLVGGSGSSALAADLKSSGAQVLGGLGDLRSALRTLAR